MSRGLPTTTAVDVCELWTRRGALALVEVTAVVRLSDLDNAELVVVVVIAVVRPSDVDRDLVSAAMESNALRARSTSSSTAVVPPPRRLGSPPRSAPVQLISQSINQSLSRSTNQPAKQLISTASCVVG